MRDEEHGAERRLLRSDAPGRGPQTLAICVCLGQVRAKDSAIGPNAKSLCGAAPGLGQCREPARLAAVGARVRRCARARLARQAAMTASRSEHLPESLR